MILLLGALIFGLILSLLALGVLITFRLFNFPDITAEGSITFGGAVTAVLLTHQVNPWAATAAGFFAGMLAGLATGILHVKFKINGLLAGILVMTALYSINLHVMGKSNVPLLESRTLITDWEDAGMRLANARQPKPELGFDGKPAYAVTDINILGWDVAVRSVSVLAAMIVFVTVAGVGFFVFFRTDFGTAMRATGDNDQMIRALGVNTGWMVILGVAISNGFIGLTGALQVQYQGFADVQMGIGMVVWGLASVIIGEALTGTRSLGLSIYGAILGSTLFRLLVAIALQWGLNPNDLRLITALFVFAALVLPGFIRYLPRKKITGDLPS